MRNLCFAILFLTVAPMAWFSSCAKVEGDDTEAPVVSDVRFNMDDSIVWQGEKIWINSKNRLPKDSIDTLVIGKWIVQTAHFSDNRALSGYIVYMDSIGLTNNQRRDTAFTFLATGKNITDSTSVFKRHSLVLIPDSLALIKPTEKEAKRAVRQGDYIMWTVVGDKANNRDSVRTRVKILSRDSIYKIRHK